ncbi:MAG: LLM class flavin-dependent oxidoreductase [Nitrososphaerales archaeon]
MVENAVIGYWAAQEQYSPDELTQFAIAAENGGFETVVSSDHFIPWFNSGAHGGFTWAWMSGTAAYTKKIKFGTGVTAPDRYHPAVIAQAFATLDSMFPGRFMLGLGAGEAMNSIPLGIIKPSAGQSVLRLKDALEIITRLWSGNFEQFDGFFYRLRHAKLYTPPRTKIPIFVAAGGHSTAELAGEFGDGIIGFSGGEDVMKVALDSAKKHGKDVEQFGKMIEFKCSFASDYEKAIDSVKVWRSTMVPNILSSDISDPRELEEKGSKEVSDKKIEETWTIVTNVEDLINPIQDLVKKGYNYIQVHSSSPDEIEFVKQFTTRALPHLRQMYAVAQR